MSDKINKGITYLTQQAGGLGRMVSIFASL